MTQNNRTPSLDIRFQMGDQRVGNGELYVSPVLHLTVLEVQGPAFVSVAKMFADAYSMKIAEPDRTLGHECQNQSIAEKECPLSRTRFDTRLGPGDETNACLDQFCDLSNSMPFLSFRSRRRSQPPLDLLQP